MISQTSFILLLLLLNNIVANNHNRNILTKRTIIDNRKPLPKKLSQHAYYYSIKNAVDNKISYHDSYNYLYRKNNIYYNKY